MDEKIGISNISVCIPSGRLTLQEMSRSSSIPEDFLLKKVGAFEIPVLDEGRSSIELAIQSAKDIIAQAALNPSEIDYILYCSCGIQNKYMWSPAAKVQQAINATSAFSFEITNGCNAGNLGINIAVSMLRSNPGKHTALVIICDALSKIVDRYNSDHMSIFNFADCATSILIKRGEQRNNIISSAAQTISDFVDHMSLSLDDKTISMVNNENEDTLLSETYARMYPNMILNALSEANLCIDDVACLFMNQGDYGLIKKLSKLLNISESKIFKSYEQYGHMGGADIFYGMYTQMKHNQLKPGDIVVLASSAIGFSWSATVIKI